MYFIASSGDPGLTCYLSTLIYLQQHVGIVTLLITLSRIKLVTAAKSLQSCLTLCDPVDGSPPGSPVPEILQARTLEWVAISFSNAWKWKVKVKSLSRVWLFDTPWTAAYQAPPSMGFSRQEYWSGLPLPSPKFVTAKSLQSCPTLCDPIDGSPAGSPVPEILQARTLEWVAISFPNAWKWKVKVKSLSRVGLLATPWTAAHQAPPPMVWVSLSFLNYLPVRVQQQLRSFLVFHSFE